MSGVIDDTEVNSAHAEGKAPGDRREPPCRTCPDTRQQGGKENIDIFSMFISIWIDEKVLNLR